MKAKWEWDNFATVNYNIVAKFEETLINLGVMADFSNIEDTEGFVDRNYTTLPKEISYEYNERFIEFGFKSDHWTKDFHRADD